MRRDGRGGGRGEGGEVKHEMSAILKLHVCITYVRMYSSNLPSFLPSFLLLVFFFLFCLCFFFFVEFYSIPFLLYGLQHSTLLNRQPPNFKHCNLFMHIRSTHLGTYIFENNVIANLKNCLLMGVDGYGYGHVLSGLTCQTLGIEDYIDRFLNEVK